MSAFAATYNYIDKLPSGARVRLRAIQPNDKQALREAVQRLSEQSMYMRFLAPRKLTDKDLAYLTELDFDRHVALVAEMQFDGQWKMIGVGRFICDEDNSSTAEVALTVGDDFQGKGVGSLLLKHLANIAVRGGIRNFHALVLRENFMAKHLLESIKASVRTEAGPEGTLLVRGGLHPQHAFGINHPCE